LSKSSNTPTHLVLTPSNSSKILNFINLNDIGADTLKTSTAFKKIQAFSKTNPQHLFASTSDFTTRYGKLCDLYATEVNLSDALTYGVLRQHQFTSNSSYTNHPSTYLDLKSINRLVQSNYDTVLVKNSTNRTKLTTTTFSNSLLNSIYNKNHLIDLVKVLIVPTMFEGVGVKSSDKVFTNLIKFGLGYGLQNKTFCNTKWVSGLPHSPDLSHNSPFVTPRHILDYTNRLYTLTDPRGAGGTILSQDKNIRYTTKFFPNFTLKQDTFEVLNRQLFKDSLLSTHFHVFNAGVSK